MLSQTTQDKIDKAIADRDAARSADDAHAQSVRALQQADDSEKAAAGALSGAKDVALASAHDALDALMLELSVPTTPPVDAPPVSPGP